jgi:hypothetical protein
MTPEKPLIQHWVDWEERSAASKRSQKTVCQTWVEPKQVTHDSYRVTCDECRRWLNKQDGLEWR